MHKEAVESERESGRRGVCAKKKGVRRSLCSGEPMKQYTSVWQSVVVSVTKELLHCYCFLPPLSVHFHFKT